jgi:hypothetical protein
VAGSTGLRIAVNNLARFVPGWGSAFGATTSFATTFALGQVANRYFASGREIDPAELKSFYEAARAEGRTTYESRKEDIAAATATHGEKLSELSDSLASGEMSRAEYEAALTSLE